VKCIEHYHRARSGGQRQEFKIHFIGKGDPLKFFSRWIRRTRIVSFGKINLVIGEMKK
jgi:hypothetical protein